MAEHIVSVAKSMNFTAFVISFMATATCSIAIRNRRFEHPRPHPSCIIGYNSELKVVWIVLEIEMSPRFFVSLNVIPKIGGVNLSVRLQKK